MSYNIAHCILCNRELHIHKNRITGFPEPCEHIRKISGKQRVVAWRYINSGKDIQRKVYIR